MPPPSAIRHTLGRAPQPKRRLLVLFDTDPFGKAEANIEGGDKITGRGRLREPSCNPGWIVGASHTIEYQIGKFDR